MPNSGQDADDAGDQSSQAEPDHRSADENNGPAFSKLIIVEPAIGFWAAGCLGAAGFFNEHYPFSSAALLACMITSAVYLLAAIWQQRVRRRRLKSLWHTVAIAVNCLFLGTLPFGFRDLLVPQVERFHVTTGAILRGAMDPAVSAPMYALPPVFDAPIAPRHRVDLLFSALIENEQQVQSTIIEMQLETSATGRGNWIALCPVDTSGERLFIAPKSLTEAYELDTSKLPGQDFLGSLLEPLVPVRTTSAWSCPGTCGWGFLRLSLTEANGHKTVSLLPVLQDGKPPLMTGRAEALSLAPKGIWTPLDLSKNPEAPSPFCKASKP